MTVDSDPANGDDKPRAPLVEFWNRHIGFGLFAGLLTVVGGFAARDAWPQVCDVGWGMTLVDVLPALAAGMVVDLAQRDSEAIGRRDRPPLMADLGVTLLWLLLVTGAINPGVAAVSRTQLLYLVGAWAAGLLVGVMPLSPLARAFVDLEVRGTRPFRAIIRWTASVDSPNVRFALRLLLQTVVASTLLALALAAFVIVVICILLFLLITFLTASKPGGTGARSRYTTYVHDVENTIVERVRGHRRHRTSETVRLQGHSWVIQQRQVDEDGDPVYVVEGPQ